MTAIKVPPLGESIVEATISRWAKQPGDAVAAGETLVELETDKVTVEVPALRAGVMGAHNKNEGDVVKVDDVLGELDESAVPATASATAKAPAAAQRSDAAAAAAALAAAPPLAPSIVAAATPAPSTAGATSAASTAGATGSAASAGAASAGASASGAVRASPSAQRVAAAQGVDLASVAGSGRGGVISKPDVLDHLARVQAAPPPVAPTTPGAAPTRAPASNGARETREKMSTRRRRIAENLLQAQHATAHLTTFNEIDMTAVTALRDRLRERVEKDHGVRLSFMPFFVKAASLALAKYPVVNAQIDGDTIVYKHYVNMGIAVASEQGLVVPVIKDADAKGLIAVSREITSVAGRGRDGKLTLDDLTGGTFTITNGGVFGSLVSTPILNYPQVGILGLHKIQDRPIAERGQVVIRPMMYVALSYDHRIVDGQQAVLFLVRIKELMEDPASMLVE
jgi:2-oxoglutarate dehydrogenase E2 component (dihydrolipoamide succinyltransferase)